MGGAGRGQGLSAILRPQGAKEGDKVVVAPGLFAEVLSTNPICRQVTHCRKRIFNGRGLYLEDDFELEQSGWKSHPQRARLSVQSAVKNRHGISQPADVTMVSLHCSAVTGGTA